VCYQRRGRIRPPGDLHLPSRSGRRPRRPSEERAGTPHANPQGTKDNTAVPSTFRKPIPPPDSLQRPGRSGRAPLPRVHPPRAALRATRSGSAARREKEERIVNRWIRGQNRRSCYLRSTSHANNREEVRREVREIVTAILWCPKTRLRHSSGHYGPSRDLSLRSRRATVGPGGSGRGRIRMSA